MSAEKLLNMIKKEAQDEADRVIGEARKKHNEIMGKAERGSESVVKEILDRAKSDSEAVRNKHLALARLEVKMGGLSQRGDALERVFDKACEKLQASRHKKDYIHRAVKRNSKEFGETVELVVSKADRKLLTTNFLRELSRIKKGTHFSAAKDSADIAGGVIIRLKDMNVEINESFDAKLEAMRQEPPATVLKTVFGGK
jgi:vacuolar-type H+-ATPase subunit E/Vma4